jgi:hypothetical protein
MAFALNVFLDNYLKHIQGCPFRYCNVFSEFQLRLNLPGFWVCSWYIEWNSLFVLAFPLKYNDNCLISDLLCDVEWPIWM